MQNSIKEDYCAQSVSNSLAHSLTHPPIPLIYSLNGLQLILSCMYVNSILGYDKLCLFHVINKFQQIYEY